jgi:hypothetical protein
MAYPPSLSSNIFVSFSKLYYFACYFYDLSWAPGERRTRVKASLFTILASSRDMPCMNLPQRRKGRKGATAMRMKLSSGRGGWLRRGSRPRPEELPDFFAKNTNRLV